MFLLLFNLAASRVLLSNSEEKAFVSWMRNTNNYFAGDEYHFRLGIFLSNQRFVQSHNKNEANHFKLALNKFAAYTPAEYRSLLGVDSSRRLDNSNIRPKARKTLTVPESIDWREKGAVSDIKDQGSCGSCWSFGAIVAQEGAHALATGELITLSEQNLVDCCNIECHGCFGGWPDKALTYVISNQGGKFNLLSDYVYTATEGTCRFEDYIKVSSIFGVQGVTQGDEDELKFQVGSQGPVAICVDCSNASFQLYSSGIYSEPKCKKYIYNHAMGIIGYGSENGEDYWIVRNSWGLSWGEKGYVRFARGSDMCNIADAVFYSIYQ
ncbi:Crustapain [Tritrichomonas foetus]|uniref:Crustapain n=1 Tax=Tritrichomonas foetus TaxID=1144522 RepID=A0A1J4JI91_9EUKA|nr:Crustapain [Tritrichomonas foetus]|eukprot:OHS96908.1 Crustapain [Tritrichomonas foetus]